MCPVFAVAGILGLALLTRRSYGSIAAQKKGGSILRGDIKAWLSWRGRRRQDMAPQPGEDRVVAIEDWVI